MPKNSQNKQPKIEYNELKELMLLQPIIISINAIAPNNGQIPDVPKNPRLIHNEKFKKLKESIENDPEFLAVRELMVYFYEGKYVTIGGNMRYHACRELKKEAVPCKVIPADTPKEKLVKWALLDNASFGDWDWEALANEWDKGLLDACCIDLPEVGDVKEEEEAKDDEFDVSAAVKKEAVSKLGDIYKLGNHRLICGDSTREETISILMGTDQADCIITDPPYNVNYEGSNGKKIENDNMADAAFQDFLHAAFNAANNHLKPGGVVYIWHADSEGYNFRAACKRVGWKVRQCLIWRKNSLVLGRQDYQWQHEPCLYLWKEGAGHYFIGRRDLTTIQETAEDLDIEKLSKQEMKDLLQKMLNIPTTIMDEKKPAKNDDHPTMKPVPLIGRQVKNSTLTGQLVLDMFGGSGTTLIACEQLGRRCATVEFDPVYCDVIIKRWEELTGCQAEYLGNYLNEKDREEQR